MALRLSPQTIRTAAIIVVGLLISFILLGFPQFMNAMTLGAIYALIALGYTMVYGIIELINFAHGDIFMVGAFASLWVLTTPLNLLDRPINDPLQLTVTLIIVVVPVMIFMGLVGAIIERFAYRPLRHAPRLAPLITAIGVSFILQNVIQALFGPSPHPTPQIFPQVDVLSFAGLSLNLGSVSWVVQGGTARALNLTMIAAALVLMAILQLFVNRTRLGRAMRSTAQDREAAALMGVDINQTIAITFFIAAALAGAGGMIYGLYFGSIQFNLGFYTGLKAFTAAVLGGIGNTVGAAIGGFIIAFIEVASIQAGYSRWSEVAVFTVLILVLVFRPSGLFGQALGERA